MASIRICPQQLPRLFYKPNGLRGIQNYLVKAYIIKGTMLDIFLNMLNAKKKKKCPSPPDKACMEPSLRVCVCLSIHHLGKIKGQFKNCQSIQAYFGSKRTSAVLPREYHKGPSHPFINQTCHLPSPRFSHSFLV